MKTIYKNRKKKNLVYAIGLFSLFVLIILFGCKEEGCEYDNTCGGSDTKPKVDLIILIDTSGSMGVAAKAVSTEATTAIAEALKVCNSDLRVEYLGVDGTWGGTNFITSHINYLTTLHGSGVVLSSNQGHIGYSQEEGGNAIEDLSKLYDWRVNACRAIFYISDEELDSSSPIGDIANEDAVTASAISAAIGENVTVSANYITRLNRGASILKNYTDLTTQTKGKLFTVNSIPANYYQDNKVFDDIICNACSGCN